jgi:tellurite resistance protein
MAVETTPQALDATRPADAALLALLAAVAFADGEVDDDEVQFLKRVLPGRTDAALRQWAKAAGARPLKLEAIARALPSMEERWRALRFTVRMAWKDGTLHAGEKDLLEQLCVALEMPPDALARALAELSGRGAATVDPQRIVAQFKELKWDSIDWAEGPVLGPLRKHVPAGCVGVLRVGVDGIEVMGFYREGILASFREGDAFLPWKDIVTFTRAATLGAAVELHTEDGRRYSLPDFRLAGIGQLLDRLYAAEPTAAKGAAPRIVQLSESADD